MHPHAPDLPAASDIQALPDAERERLLPDTSGEVSDGTPLLASASPECFALAVLDLEGQLHTTDQADLELSIQSVVKPWVYAAALSGHGHEVHRRIGVGPTGEPFDALVLEEEEQLRLHRFAAPPT